ncbi:chromobox protein homolog hpl-1 [Drosophila gunungcola]|uniref:chromobox protein homolog hpl-1 n=1 Tax=Drosophila gunungcola TaxID=103775 RepID=UPI0022E79C29|nr:chromobox protein homolog hpl-1 [Drosophila gunungcola]
MPMDPGATARITRTTLVEKFIGKRFLRGRAQYLAKWEGYPEEESTWEPMENLGNCATLVADYEAELFKRNMEQKKFK